MFRDRTDAGKRLADLLDRPGVDDEYVEREADEVIADATPPHFGAVGQFYESFDQVSDEETMAYLGE